MKEWIPLIAAFLGFLAGISGTWWTQRSNRQLEAAKWEREQAKAKHAERRQLYLAIAEHVEDRLSWLRAMDRLTDDYAPAELEQRDSQIAARIKLFATHATEVAWEDFQSHLDAIRTAFLFGRVEITETALVGEHPNIARPDDKTLVPRAMLAAELVTLSIRADIEGIALYDLALELRSRLVDPRLVQAWTSWMDAATRIGQPWREVLATRENGLLESAPKPK